MNPPTIEETAIHQRAKAEGEHPHAAELIALPQRGRALRFLTALCALITGALGVASFADMLPPHYAGAAALITITLMGIKDAAISIGDHLDDGVKNGSFSANPSTLRQWFLFFLVGCLCVSCVNEGSTDAQVRRSQLLLSGARITLIAAESQLGAVLADPKTPIWQRTAAQMLVDEAKAAVADEQLRLRSLMAARNVARFAAPAVPVIDLTSAK